MAARQQPSIRERRARRDADRRHVCNDIGRWGKGFVIAVSKRWKEPETAYRRWYSEGGADPFELGQVLMVKVVDDLWVANLVGQVGIHAKAGVRPVRYEAIAEGLERVAEFAQQQGASVHIPRIGCGLAGGKWEEIEPIIERTLLFEGHRRDGVRLRSGVKSATHCATVAWCRNYLKPGDTPVSSPIGAFFLCCFNGDNR